MRLSILLLIAAIAAPRPTRADQLRFSRGPVGGGCPEERHATCRNEIVEAFAIDARPASLDDYRTCVAARACPPLRPDNDGEEGTRGPALTVASGEHYCAWRGLRLPTEGEWERARLEAPSAFHTPDAPMVKELLVGWYTWIGPQGSSVPIGQPSYNSRLVIRMYQGASYRYGIHLRKETPDLTFRCVSSRYRPAADAAIAR
jgi:sulfatase-modifying factor enzyme 1